jgi:hypothetical protein
MKLARFTRYFSLPKGNDTCEYIAEVFPDGTFIPLFVYDGDNWLRMNKHKALWDILDNPSNQTKCQLKGPNCNHGPLRFLTENELFIELL